MEIILFIGGIVLLVLFLNLRGRVGRLERLLVSQPKSGVIRGPAAEAASEISDRPAAVPLASYIEEGKAEWFGKFINWLKEDWLLKLGALLLLIGFAWFATYAFLHNWIGPMGRIALGIIAGAGILIFGWFRIRKYLNQGGVFLVLGSTVILLTIFAAREIYGFFTPGVALIVMFLSTALVAAASVRYRTVALALASIALAGVAPLLTNAPKLDYVGLFSYLMVVTLGTLWIVALTRRRELTAAALLLIVFYSLPHLLSLTSKDADVVLLFIYAFAGVFFITNTLGILKLKDKEIIPDLITAAGNGLFLLAWIMTAAPENWQSLIISAWMVVFAAGAFAIFRLTGRREPFYAYAGVSIAMLAAATSAELSGATLTLAYTIESGLIALVAYGVLRDLQISERVSLLLAGPTILSFQSIVSRAWDRGVFHKDFFVLLVLGVVIGGLGLFWQRRSFQMQKRPSKISVGELVAGSIALYALLWLSLHAALLNDDTAVMISLVIYTLIGLTANFFGKSREKRGLRIYGGLLLAFVVGRLLTVDVWRMELTGRIITFFLVGALLMSTAFLGRKKRSPAS